MQSDADLERWFEHDEDLSWLGRGQRARYIAEIVAPMLVIALGGWACAIELAAHHHIVLALLMTCGTSFGAVSVLKRVHGAAQARLSRRLAACAEPQRGLLMAHDDGELVRVRGVARALEGNTLQGWLFFCEVNRPTLPHALRLPLSDLSGSRVERAVDFLLEADDETMHVDVANSRLVGAELGVRDGDVIEVVGYKDRRVEQTVEERLARDVPMRAVLRSGAQPLFVLR